MMPIQKGPNERERGSAMVLVLVILTAVFVTCGLVLTGVAMQTKFIRRSMNRKQAMYSAEAGAYKAMWMFSRNSGGEWRPDDEIVPLFDNETARVSVEDWGGFVRVTSTAVYKKSPKTVRVLAGEKPPAAFRQAVILSGLGYPLVVTGKNRIVGDVSVGRKGVETGWIQGRGFEGDEPVEGRIFKSDHPEMPYFDPARFNRAAGKYRGMLAAPHGVPVEERLDDAAVRGAETRNFHSRGSLLINGLGEQSEIRGPLTVLCSGDLSINGNTRLGNWIELAADGKITVTGRAVLRNCVLYAGRGIEIGGDSRVEGQALSPGDIVITGRAVLEYPSIVYGFCRTVDNSVFGRIALQGQAEVQGSLVLHPEEEKTGEGRDESLIVIEKNATLTGILFSNHYALVEGTVFGCAASDAFTLVVPPTTYVNWLKDAVIDRSVLPGVFVMPLRFSEKPRMETVMWEEDRMPPFPISEKAAAE